MKKLFLAVALIAMVGFATSCNKEKTCVCTAEVSVGEYTSTVSLGEKVIESGSCSDLEDNAVSFNVPGIVAGSIHCERK